MVTFSLKDNFQNLVKNNKELQDVVSVLQALSQQGLAIPSIASGYVRGWLTGTSPTDIDIQYAGTVSQTEAQNILKESISNLNVEYLDWDIEGIWNTELWKGIKTPEEYYRIFFITSIDSVYLSADGTFHDTTGYGFEDAQNNVLRMNDFTKIDFPYTDEDIIYLCIRGCERVARNKWTPTTDSIRLISGETHRWMNLSKDRQEFLIRDYILSKFPQDRLLAARAIYERFGWGFIFDQVIELSKS